MSVALTLGAFPVRAQTPESSAAADRAAADGRRPVIAVLVYNYARVPSDVMTGAKATVSRLYRYAGVETSWAEPSVDPGSMPFDSGAREESVIVQMIIRAGPIGPAMGLVRGRPRGRTGMAFVSFERITKVAHDQDVAGPPVQDILGYVMAHEIAHLVLPSLGHTRFGLMREHWDERDLRLMAAGFLRFTTSEERQILDRCRSSWRDADDRR